MLGTTDFLVTKLALLSFPSFCARTGATRQNQLTHFGLQFLAKSNSYLGHISSKVINVLLRPTNFLLLITSVLPRAASPFLLLYFQALLCIPSTWVCSWQVRAWQGFLPHTALLSHHTFLPPWHQGSSSYLQSLSGCALPPAVQGKHWIGINTAQGLLEVKGDQHFCPLKE